MIAAIASRFADQGQRHIDRYAAWQVAVQRLRDDWAKGGRPSVARLRDSLAAVPTEQRAEALEDLIADHLRLSWQAGRGTTLEKYLQEFGREFEHLASPATVPADLVEDEFLARFQPPHGDSPSLEEYAFRFPGRDDVMKLLRDRCLSHGRYVKLHTRGQGAMGEVVEAFDRHLSRRVAIKEPNVSAASNNGVIGHFANEAQMTAELEHPGIVAVHEYFSANGAAPFFVMRLVNGRPLSDLIRDYHERPHDRGSSDQRLRWNRLLQSFVAVCDAMDFAHDRGVIHRDLKPGNIVVGEFGETVILDWGLAQRVALASPSPRKDCSVTPTRDASEDSTPTRSDSARLRSRAHASGCCPAAERSSWIVGTPQYMPPEQADGSSDLRSDVFGLGAILYEILTARPPHAWPEGFRPAGWLRQVREARFTPPRRLKPKTPRALQAICLRALARDPAQRYQSAAELAHEIRRFLAGVPIRPRRDTLLVRAWNWLRRKRI